MRNLLLGLLLTAFFSGSLLAGISEDLKNNKTVTQATESAKSGGMTATDAFKELIKAKVDAAEAYAVVLSVYLKGQKKPTMINQALLVETALQGNLRRYR